MLTALIAVTPHSGQGQAAEPVLQLPVRAHLLNSAESQALTTTWTETDVATLLGVVNEVWAQAGIEWVLESVAGNPDSITC